MTRMPNFFRHKSQSEASGELSKFLPVIQTNCSSELNFFLCSLYIPRCRAYKTLPCKELCVRVRKSCRVQFREIGFKFPVSCSKLPRKDESSQCIDGSRPTQMAKTTPSSAGNNNNNNNNFIYIALKSNNCRSHLVYIQTLGTFRMPAWPRTTTNSS